MNTIATSQLERFHFVSQRDGVVKARAFLFENAVRTYRKAVLGIRTTGRYGMYRHQLIEAYCAAKRILSTGGELTPALERLELRADNPTKHGQVAWLKKHRLHLEARIALHSSLDDKGYRYVTWPAPGPEDYDLRSVVVLFQQAGWEQADFGPDFAMRRPEPGA